MGVHWKDKEKDQHLKKQCESTQFIREMVYVILHSCCSVGCIGDCGR